MSNFPPPYSSLCTRCGVAGHAADVCPTWLDHPITPEQAARNRAILERELRTYHATQRSKMRKAAA
jgi:hypothetical protein